MSVVSVRVPKDLKEKMRRVQEDWVSHLRRMIERRIKEQEMLEASKRIDGIRSKITKGAFDTARSINTGARLYTLDLKHFKPLRAHGLKLFPYAAASQASPKTALTATAVCAVSFPKLPPQSPRHEERKGCVFDNMRSNR